MQKKNMNYFQAQRKYNLPRLIDTDKDGIVNMWDCRPYDPNRDGILGRTVNVVSRGKYGQSKEDYAKEKIEKLERKLKKEKHKMPKEPVYGYEYEYHSQNKKESKKLGTGEPILLYVRTGLGRYELVDQTFPSRIEASQYADEYFKGTPKKILTEKEAIAEAEKIQHLKEKATDVGKKVVGGAKAVGRGLEKVSQKVGEAETKYKEYWDRQEQRKIEREERELERMRKANERLALKMEKEALKEQERERYEELKEQADLKRQELEKQKIQKEYNPRIVQTQTSIGRFNMPNIWAPKKTSINTPPPMTTKEPTRLSDKTKIKSIPWSTYKPASSVFNMPNIWEPKKNKEKK